MWILLTLALAASDEGAKAASPVPQLRAMVLTAPQTEWFRTAHEGRDPAEMICTIRVLKADPKFDARMVRPSPPDLDPKIVRPSPCRK